MGIPSRGRSLPHFGAWRTRRRHFVAAQQRGCRRAAVELCLNAVVAVKELHLQGALLLLLGSVACGSGRNQTPALPIPVDQGLVVQDPSTIIRPEGEELVARAELLGIHVGQLSVRLGPFCSEEGPDTERAESRFDTAGMARWFRRAEGQSWTELDARTLFPRSSRFEFQNGDAWRNYALRFSKRGYSFELETSRGDRSRGGASAKGRNYFYDPHSAFLVLRSWQPEPYEKTYFYVVLGKDPWRIDITYQGKTSVEYRGVARQALHLKGVAHRTDLKEGDRYTPREFQVWLTDDEQRLPIEFVGDATFGSFRLLLEESRRQSPCFQSAWHQR